MASVRAQTAMNPRWQKIEEAVCTAVDLPLNQRAAWIDQFCEGDRALREEIESLLSAEQEAQDFLEHSASPYAETLLESDDAQLLPFKIGQYRVLREIGRGGMGVVYLAEREDEFKQQVAIKLVKRGLDTEEILQRFRNERQILASLNHPNIAKLFDGGTPEDGLPYFVMEYIEGEPFLQCCDTQSLSTSERLRLFRRVCAAVQHAHQNLIIHRDLKPSNILVTNEGMVKLLDFGVAKLLSAEGSDDAATQTQAAARVMTPEYASPEQIRGQHVTTATDVYSLGVVLYELLTGVKPYKLKDTSAAEISRAICEAEPSKPSEAVSRQSSVVGGKRNERRTTDNGQKANRQFAIRNPKSLKGDLDNIILMALRKEPERRYKSVEQFSEDIRRHLEGLPVSARKDTFAYLASKFIGRNRLAVAGVSLIILAIISGLIVALWEAQNVRRQRDLAQHERSKAERLNRFLQRMLSFSNSSVTSVSPLAQSRDVTVNQMLDQITPQLEAELADQPEVRAQVLRTIGSAYASNGRYDVAERNLREALDLQSKLYGEESGETTATIIELGILSFRQFKLDEADRLLAKAVAFYRKQRQMNAREYSAIQFALSLDYLGVVKFFRGDANAALQLVEEALQISSSANLRGPERGIIAFNKGDLGSLLLNMGDVDKADVLLTESVAEYDQISIQPPWERGVTTYLLGVVDLRKNRLDAAEKHLLEGERILRHTLGEQNLYLANCLNQQATLLVAKNDLKGAEAKARESLRMMQEALPNNKILWAGTMQTLGSVLIKAGRAREGEDYYRQALAIHEQQPTKNYVLIVQAKIRLSQALLAQNRFLEAETIASEALSQARQQLGEQAPVTKTASENLSKIQEKHGRRLS